MPRNAKQKLTKRNKIKQKNFQNNLTEDFNEPENLDEINLDLYESDNENDYEAYKTIGDIDGEVSHKSILKQNYQQFENNNNIQQLKKRNNIPKKKTIVINPDDFETYDLEDQVDQEYEQEGEEEAEEEEAEEAEEEEDNKYKFLVTTTDSRWGGESSSYYRTDPNLNIDEADEEEEEVKRLQKLQAASLSTDYFDSAPGLEDLKNDEEENDSEIIDTKQDNSIEIILKDAPELLELVKEFSNNAQEIKSEIMPTLEKINSKQLTTSKGISFIELKFHLMLQYLINLNFYFLLKSEGKSVNDHPVVNSLIKLRVMLDKIRPLDAKLKHQFDKIIQTAVQPVEIDSKLKNSSKNQQVDALKFKPKPQLLTENDYEEDGTYIAPKIMPSNFDDDGGKKKADRTLKRASNSAMAAFLRDEYGDAPEELEISGSARTKVNKKVSEFEEKEKYEEENFVRLSTTKKDKLEMRRKSQIINEFDELENLVDINKIKQLDSNNYYESSGDIDLPYKDRPVITKRVEPEINDELEEADAYTKYYEAKRNKQLKADPKNAIKPDLEIEEGQKRKVSYQIAKNRGILPYRKKDVRNPRVRHRNRFAKVLKKTGAASKSQIVNKSVGYGGEKSAIRTNITRSTIF
eukprot:TRINITY_DN944_c0_g2_i1.p1 TRINITY_DN944_c0_g2~~TRINITY_DN944_c0_g2_i1.p1  ORF type:complete len:633 (-),score=289.87 TRINITY_DN944_c0_g2_i1:120-2018(-)